MPSHSAARTGGRVVMGVSSTSWSSKSRLTRSAWRRLVAQRLVAPRPRDAASPGRAKPRVRRYSRSGRATAGRVVLDALAGSAAVNTAPQQPVGRVALVHLVAERAQQVGGVSHAARAPRRRRGTGRDGARATPRSAGSRAAARRTRRRAGGRGGVWASPSAAPLTDVQEERVVEHGARDRARHAHAVPVLGVGHRARRRPRWGLRPNSPQQAAGMRIEPPPSVACAAPRPGRPPPPRRCRRSSHRACGRCPTGCG